MGINPNYSSVWNTSCTPDFGNCGCDNCVGSLVDVRQRVGSFKERMQIMGWERDKAVWSVPQAFESEGLRYWNATPTGQQWLAFTFLSLTHGARGSVSFSYPTTTGNVTTIEGTAPGFSGVFDSVVLPYVFGEGISSGVNEAVDGKFDSYFINGVDVGIWWNSTVSSLENAPTLLARDSPVGSNATIGPNTALIILTNTLLDPSFVAFDVIGLGGLTNATEQVERVFSVNSRTNVSGLVPEGEGVGIYLVQL
ncbi:hypothetical protein SERLA73DRAFT_187702 [Serpula lacrymans var. lacrymans S7.3]|uniref:Uncharacterized protein n=1 Tax=Serpula lacrymans var. lacrymans (strain S7.3) TaxID=936435 RepID=F8QA67_SERL3|nr:hypothetical protein SERLA73DRAFT_187702 [Serpula lacrymans var. lacrymans S7.3]